MECFAVRTSKRWVMHVDDENESPAGTGSPRGKGHAEDARAEGPGAGRPNGPIDHARIERAVREILLAVGEDPDREGLRETPARVARMYAELFAGLHLDPRRHLKKFFTERYDEVVLVRDISFQSMCEHHMLPFLGKAHVAYLPGPRIVGLSKLARVVEEVARRPQVQERMTEQIANLLVEELQVKGRGRDHRGRTYLHDDPRRAEARALCITSAMKGHFRTGSSTRAELMTLIYGDRR